MTVLFCLFFITLFESRIPRLTPPSLHFLQPKRPDPFSFFAMAWLVSPFRRRIWIVTISSLSSFTASSSCQFEKHASEWLWQSLGIHLPRLPKLPFENRQSSGLLTRQNSSSVTIGNHEARIRVISGFGIHWQAQFTPVSDILRNRISRSTTEPLRWMAHSSTGMIGLSF